MYPAIEIDLHLDRISAAQRPNPAALEGALPTLDVRHQPAPPSTHPGDEGQPRCGDRRTADEARHCG
jgi:hypothetical protein